MVERCRNSAAPIFDSRAGAGAHSLVEDKMSDDLNVRRIKWLARRSAVANLTLKQAQNLFGALYAADALMIAEGNMTKAAERSGVSNAASLRRISKRMPDARQETWR